MRSYRFFLMFSTLLLLHVNYALLRGIRNTLAVVALGNGAHSIPFFELFGALPGSIFMTWILARCINRFSIEKVFSLTLTVFLGFFIIFTTIIYPFLASSKSLSFIFSMLFYVMAELWKPALSGILFWGLINQHMPLSEAKNLYAPLMLGGSLGSILAGPIISLCSSTNLWQWFPLASEHWTHCLYLMIAFVTFLGTLAGVLYYRLWKSLTNDALSISFSTDSISLKDSIALLRHYHPLSLLSWLVISDYIAYSLGEVIFLHVLKLRFPDPTDYCYYMGQLSFGNGLLTFLSSLLIAPWIVKRCQWITVALITPLCLLVTEGLFFLFLRIPMCGLAKKELMEIIVFMGSIQYCVCRAVKYTLFDLSKEMAFLYMPALHKMKGKLVIDGLSARIGRGAASFLSISFIFFTGGIMASSLLTGIVAISTCISWIRNSLKLWQQLDIASKNSNAQNISNQKEKILKKH